MAEKLSSDKEGKFISKESIKSYLEKERQKLLETEEGREAAQFADYLIKYVKERKAREKEEKKS